MMLIIGVIIVLVVVMFIMKTNIMQLAFYESFRKLYTWDTARLQKKFSFLPEVIDAKKKLFSSMSAVLNEVEGPILELGAGSGANLEFYPEGTMLHTVDLNEHFREHLEKNLKTFKHVTLEKYFICDASDMSVIPDSSYSCVVSTLLLCCIDPQIALQEIYRVLKPGGRFYFMEHIIEEPGTWMRFIQETLKGTWQAVRFNCNLTSQSNKIIQESKDFENLNAYIYNRQIDWQYSFCRRCYIGYVDKPAKVM